MKKLLSLAIGLICLPFLGQAQELPQLSPFAKNTQKVGLTEITVEYSRPSVRGRTIFGDLVPYGKVWRTGANACTKVTFSTDVTVSGKEVKAGTYALFTIPGKNSWTIVLNSNVKQWGSSKYDETLNVASVNVKPVMVSRVETFRIDVCNITNNGADLNIAWDRVSANLSFTVPTQEIAEKNIEKKLNELKNPHGTYYATASYYLSIKENKKALKYAKLACKNSDKFWYFKMLSEAYAANNDYKNAIKEAKHSLELAKKANYDEYVKINEKNITKWTKKAL
ncbi:MAG: DUF2911 domain-containing protein [Cytophagales bacterium]|nr:DUF2911 domain-containing protein [Cytophagales bacterium]